MVENINSENSAIFMIQNSQSSQHNSNNACKRENIRTGSCSINNRTFPIKVTVLSQKGNHSNKNGVTKNKAWSLENISYWNGIYVFAVLCYCILFTSLLILIPQHDAIEHPQYWYELILIFSLGFPFHLVFSTLQVCNIIFKIKCMTSIETVARLFLASILGFVLPYLLCYVVWSTCLGYNHPLPFLGVFCVYPFWLVFMVRLWFEFTDYLRKKTKFRRRIQAYMLYMLWLGVMGLQYSGLSGMLAMLPTEIQWIMAIIMPLMREFNSWILTKLTHTASSYDNSAAMFAMNTTLSCGYSLYVAITLASATEVTLYSILGVEFTLNLFLCFKIIWIQKKMEIDDSENLKQAKAMERSIVRLTLNETIEVLVPLSYAITFVLAYYGPNATILGNVRNSYWNYEEVKDIRKLLLTSFEMFSIDLISAIISGVLLWKFCNINLFREFCKIMKSYWKLIAITLAGYIYEVCFLGHLKLSIIHSL